MKTVPSVTTLLINGIYLSHSILVAGGNVFRIHSVNQCLKIVDLQNFKGIPRRKKPIIKIA